MAPSKHVLVLQDQTGVAFLGGYSYSNAGPIYVIHKIERY
jgi:hypothetical protein